MAQRVRRGYIAAMRRSTVFRLLGAVLVIGIGAYTAFWWIAAGKIADAATAWRDTVRAEKIDASWQGLRIAGYPFSFRIELSSVTVRSGATDPPIELTAPTVWASVRPWSLHT